MFNNERLKKLRKDLKFSQEEMAKELNMHQTTYSRYETNEADINLQMLQQRNEWAIKHTKKQQTKPVVFFIVVTANTRAQVIKYNGISKNKW